jgi:hypothetical protein
MCGVIKCEASTPTFHLAVVLQALMDLHHGNHFAREFLADDGMAEVCMGIAHFMQPTVLNDKPSKSALSQLKLPHHLNHVFTIVQVLNLLHHHDEYVSREAFLLADALIQQVCCSLPLDMVQPTHSNQRTERCRPAIRHTC